MKLFHLLGSLVLLSAISLTACNAEQPAPAPPTATPVSFLTQPEATPTPVVEPASAATTEPLPPPSTSTPTPAPTLPPEPTATNTPVSTATSLPSPTPIPAPQVTVPDSSTTAINVRSGPGTAYPVVGQFNPGQTAPVTGRNAEQSWWQVSLADNSLGWVFGELVQLSGSSEGIPVAEAPPPPPTATPVPEAEAEAKVEAEEGSQEPQTPEELEGQLRCGKDFCVTYQAMVPIWENGGCIGNHSIYVTVLQGPPPGTPLDGVVIGDTFNNIEVASGDKGPGTAEVTLWMNSMSLKVKRHIDGTPYTSEESFSFTSHDELIPAEVLAANGYCDGSVEKCRWAQQNNQVCRGHYSYRVTFHKFD
ncbi:MAG: hypothetical protein DPW09_04105 [Anaerolineae bacterium]|nr:SH3 domain-containing protein [Anaerolineales bacterium]MCQ3972615.1 hypothetical protein [Anaerolineae bacterium]